MASQARSSLLFLPELKANAGLQLFGFQFFVLLFPPSNRSKPRPNFSRQEQEAQKKQPTQHHLQLLLRIGQLSKDDKWRRGSRVSESVCGQP